MVEDRLKQRPYLRKRSTLSSSNRERPALAPQRSAGRQRVADLLAAAAAVISERGFEAATMAEIATRAEAKIGSLYRFFPNKEVLADALMQRYLELMEAAFDALEAQTASATVDALADGLIDLMVSIHDETLALSALLDARSEWSGLRLEVRSRATQRISAMLMARAPWLETQAATDIAVVVLNTMKVMAAMTVGNSAPTSLGAPHELRVMNRLYLGSKLSDR
jgi:AcrR family transcriptional regulator